MITEKVNWQKFYGEVCPVCKKPVMTKEWMKDPRWCTSPYLRNAGYKVDPHAKFILGEMNKKTRKLYPVHERCSMKLLELVKRGDWR